MSILPPSLLPSPFAASLASALRSVRRAAVLVGGGSVVMAGVAMIVLPGPALVVIPAGLGILALEFFWARRLLVRLRRSMRLVARRARQARTAHTDARSDNRPAVRAAWRAAVREEG